MWEKSELLCSSGFFNAFLAFYNLVIVDKRRNRFLYKVAKLKNRIDICSLQDDNTITLIKHFIKEETK